MKINNHPLAQGGREALRKLVLSAMFIAIGLILPFFTGQIQQIGNMLLPMHIPVFLCGLVCGWQYGSAVGFLLPLMRSLMFGMPPLYPTAAAMAVELCVYGFSVGLLYTLFKKQNVLTVYLSMIPAMLLGRGAWALAQSILLGMEGKTLTWQVFFTAGFLNAVPGIILQLILIPAVMSTLHITGPQKFRRRSESREEQE